MAKEKVGEILAKFFSFKQKENKADTIYAIQSGQRCKSMSFTDFAIDPFEKNFTKGCGAMCRLLTLLSTKL